MSDAWINDYVGTPYKVNGRDRSGLDCWGLLVVVFREIKGRALPDWRVSTTPDGDIDPASSARQVTSAVAAGQEQAVEIAAPEDWSVAVVRRHRMAHHVGLVVCAGKRVLHCSEKSRGTVCEPIDTFLRNYPHTSFWRLNDAHA